MPESLTPLFLPSEDPTDPDHATRAAWVDSQNGWGIGDYAEYVDIKAWTGSPGYSTVASLPLGRIQLNKIHVRGQQTLSAVNFTFTNTPTGLTPGQNFVALYNVFGTRIALSADQTTEFGSSGLKSVDFVTPYDGFPEAYYVAVLVNGTGTAPQIVCHGAVGSSLINFGLPIGEWRCIQTSGTYTAMPAALNLSTQNMSAINYGAILT